MTTNNSGLHGPISANMPNDLKVQMITLKQFKSILYTKYLKEIVIYLHLIGPMFRNTKRLLKPHILVLPLHLLCAHDANHIYFPTHKALKINRRK